MNTEAEGQPTPDAPPPPPQDAPTPEAPAAAGGDKEANQWAMFVHFSILAGVVIPGAGLILPIILWQIKKNEMPSVDVHGKIVVNWIISALIYSAVCFVLCFILIGFLGFLALAVMTLVYAIVGGIKANDGEVWEYPLSLKLIK